MHISAIRHIQLQEYCSTRAAARARAATVTAAIATADIVASVVAAGAVAAVTVAAVTVAAAEAGRPAGWDRVVCGVWCHGYVVWKCGVVWWRRWR